MRVTHPEAAAVALENALTAAENGTDDRQDVRLLRVVAYLAEATTAAGPWTEADLATLAGMTRHQARQAIAALVADGTLERGASMDPTGRIVVRYRVKVEA